MRRKIILARHGSTDLNDNGDRIRGWKDVPLNNHGIKQAKELGQRLKKEQFDIIVTSDLKRAKDTAKDIASATGKPIVETTKDLRPWNLGEFTGIEAKIVMEKLKPYIDNPDKKVPEGESLNDLKIRCLHGIKKILKDNPDKVPLLVAHHRNDRLLDAWSKGEGGDNIDLNTFIQKGIPPADYKIYYVYTI